MMARPITLGDLEYGLGILARIIDTQGNAVWPLFERLECELADMQSRRGRVEKHLKSRVHANDRMHEELKTSPK